MGITQEQFLQGGSVANTPITVGSTDTFSVGVVPATALATNAVTKGNGIYVSPVETGTGASQNIAHGLGVVPSAVVTTFTGSTSSQAVTEGTHTTTNAVVTVTSGATFKVTVYA
jgi:hypothetical protein